QGLARLREAGIAAESGVLEAEAAALNPGFIKRMMRGLPFVRLKIAASLDGRTALASGESQWITGPAARADGHRLRARSSAVMVGIGTALADDPRLTARDTGFAVERQPLRVVLDGDGRLPAAARLLNDGGQTLVFSATDSAAATMNAAAANIERVGRRGDHLDLEAVLRRLAELECNEVLVEAGAKLNGALLEAGLVDEIVVYLAPTLLGDAGRGMFALPGLATLADRPRLRLMDQRSLGDDWRLIYRPVET
ncbi:MAG TPA: bifunctional diaminohydroxyphosphoribosylaminopyrimidine deaminase/5-amino-6-(5-phosphoribosylamino)uracil reductase RibD, partial [Gammaproteobacteria bacterium]|nr:bifunctional diaminohydroxyphosphoribosylaminopyrimidine deaminase/5-amino-6-(5-phosphoribosylamino)uracil reductase RibD [Gammaproteobacteria bacterium]